jgi:hypothetical protein
MPDADARALGDFEWRLVMKAADGERSFHKIRSVQLSSNAHGQRETARPGRKILYTV